jgi:flagellar basal-body rod protein FlgF
MSSGLNPTASSLTALMQQYQTITNNLANASTAGFKRQAGAFASVLDAYLAGADISSVEQHTGLDLTQGTFSETGNALDLAIDGEGFFVVETPEGEMYTRCGAVHVNAGGRLVDSAGSSIAGEGGAIILPPSVSSEQVAVAADGTVSAGGQILGRLRIVDFDDPQALEAVSGTMLRAPEGVTARPAEDYAVRQGYREMSNVNMVKELVDLITVTRMYEANYKALEKSGESKEELLRVALS